MRPRSRTGPLFDFSGPKTKSRSKFLLIFGQFGFDFSVFLARSNGIFLTFFWRVLKTGKTKTELFQKRPKKCPFLTLFYIFSHFFTLFHTFLQPPARFKNLRIRFWNFWIHFFIQSGPKKYPLENKICVFQKSKIELPDPHHIAFFSPRKCDFGTFFRVIEMAKTWVQQKNNSKKQAFR